MFEYYFTFSTLAAAQLAMKVLNHFSVPCRIVLTPAALQLQGRGQSIVVRSGYYIQARDELDRLKLPYRHIFCRLVDGSFEEVIP